MILSRVLNLDRRLLHIDENCRQWPAIKEKYGAGIEIDVATPEAHFALISHLPDVTADDVVREYNLEVRTDYFHRANRVREQSLPKSGQTGNGRSNPGDRELVEEMAVIGS
jgi:hypothetical protein